MSTENKVGLVFNGRYDEADAHDGSIKPGHLIKKLSTGKVDGHATSGGVCAPIFAFEDRLSNRGGDGITAIKGLWDAYSADEKVPHGYCLPGDIVQVWIPAGAAAIVIGDPLMSNGDGGNLVKQTSTNHIVAYAEEAVDNSGGSDPVQIKARVR